MAEYLGGSWDEPYDLFISYAHADGVANIEPVVEQVETEHAGFSPSNPLKVFFDKRSIANASFWEQEIRKALRQSKMMLAFISPDYLRPDTPERPNWCRREWDEFVRVETTRQYTAGVWPGEAIVPVFLVAPPPTLRGRCRRNRNAGGTSSPGDRASRCSPSGRAGGRCCLLVDNDRH